MSIFKKWNQHCFWKVTGRVKQEVWRQAFKNGSLTCCTIRWKYSSSRINVIKYWVSISWVVLRIYKRIKSVKLKLRENA